MRLIHSRSWTTVVVFISFGSMIAALGAQTARAQTAVFGHVLVNVSPGTNISRIETDYGTRVMAQVPGTSEYALSTPAIDNDDDFVRQLSADVRVRAASLDYIASLPDVNGTQFHFAFDAGPSAGAYVNQSAYKMVGGLPSGSPDDGTGIIVAVLDTGTTPTHPALVGHLLPGYNTVSPGTAPLDVPDGIINDAVGHGTMICGIIVKVAPGAQVMPVRVLNGDGFGTLLDVLNGIDYAIANGAKVINMSFGTNIDCPMLDQALANAEANGVTLVAAAGNDGDSKVLYPAADRSVISVSSVNSNLHKSSFANFGPSVAVVAPGTGIRSTYYTGGYANWSGTSFAAPFVSAEAAIILEQEPMYTPIDVKQVLTRTANSVEDQNPNLEESLGRGIIDIYRAVRSLP